MEKAYSETLCGGVLTDYGTFLAGYYRGYQVVFSMENRVPSLSVSAVCENEETLETLKKELRVLQQAFPRLTAASQASKTGIKLVWNPQISAKKNAEGLSSVLEQLMGFLLFHGYASGCSLCGNSAYAPELYCDNGKTVYLCNTCAAMREQEAMETREEISAQSSNLPAGLIGALIGSLAGVALWLLLDQIGIIAGLAGSLMGIGAMWLYAKFGGCLDKKGVICCIVVVIIMVFAANYLAYAIAYFKVLKPYGYTFAECLKYQFEFIKLDEIVGGYILNLLIGLGLTALACAKNFAAAMQATSGPTFKKIS